MFPTVAGWDIERAIDHGLSLKDITRVLDRGAPPNTALTAALFIAVERGRKDIVALLLDREADMNAMRYGIPVLTLAVRREMTEIVSLLLDEGADINMVGGHHGTALAAAILTEQKDTVLLLLDRGADVNLVGGIYETALVAAATRGNTDIVSLLLDRGADVNLVGGEYGTALASAVARAGNTDTVSLLLDRGANINFLGGKSGTTALAIAVGKAVAVSDEGKDTVPLLLDRGADINLVAGGFGTVLGLAIFEGSTEIALFLLERGADVMHVGGSYSSASGVYPSALDAARSEGSSASPTLIARLETLVRERQQNGGIISRPPFPMPYTQGSCTNHHHHHNETSPPGSIHSPSIQFRAGGTITPEQANTPCQNLNEEVLLRSLAALVGLNEDTTRGLNQWIGNDIQYLVACSYDFGLGYAAARVAWKRFNEHRQDSSISIQRGQWHRHARVLNEERSKAIEIGTDPSSPGVQLELIKSPYSIMPRRLWDLKSNRVVDFRMLHAAHLTAESMPTFWAISHSWTSNMSPVWTPINQYQWPVPLPGNISLEYLRSELLTLGAEYVWIDVLCLRQQSEDDSLEQLRQAEWKLDVPTIGNVYRAAANIVRYFNGLGVPFSNEDWDGPRHWLQRAWTLQEIADESTTINGGVPRDRGQVLLNSKGKFSGKVTKFRDAIRPVIQLATQVDSAHGCEVYDLAREMSRRHASQPLDKLSGLFYLLRTTKLPCYDATRSSEDFWKQCFYLLPAERKAEIFFNFPYRGSDEQWFPTWAQMLDWPERDPGCDHMRSQRLPDLVTAQSGASLQVSHIWTIPNAILNKTDDLGEYEVKIGNLLLGFYSPYLSQKPIDIQDPVFTLAIADLGHAHNWVVCKAVEKEQGVWPGVDMGGAEFTLLKKVGVIRTDSCSELLVGGLVQEMDCVFV